MWIDIIGEIESDSPYIFGIDDFRVVGSRLYAKIQTGACGAPGNDYHIYYLDVRDRTWHFVLACGDCEFDGEMIKARIYWVIKSGNHSTMDEYGDSVRMIRM